MGLIRNKIKIDVLEHFNIRRQGLASLGICIQAKDPRVEVDAALSTW